MLAAASAAAAPPCDVRLVSVGLEDVRVQVSDRVETLEQPAAPVRDLRAYPNGAGAVLVAYACGGAHGPTGSESLWRIGCKSGHPERIARLAGADFGHSALSADGRTLFFTGPDGIFALDLANASARRMTTAPAFESCDLNDTPRARDVVDRFVDPRTLSFERGGPCGYEGEWEAKRMLLRNPGTRKMKVERAPVPLQSVAVDAGGGIWLADGACEDRSTYGRALYSPDSGHRWQKVLVKMFVSQPVRRVLADPAKRGSVLIFTFGCGSSAHVDPGWVYLTDDGGRTFHPIAPPPGLAAIDGMPASEQDPLEAIDAPEGTLEHLVLYGQADAAGLFARWQSRDGGRSWIPIAPAKMPDLPSSPVVSGSTRLAIHDDGLYRIDKGSPPARLYPPP